jgi:predicted phosphatase
MTLETYREKTYQDKRLHIFDYDYTLYLDGCMPTEERAQYKKYVIDKIKGLKEGGKLIAMASHNASAKWYVYELYREIYNCFDMFICQYPRDKDTMVSEILERLNCKPEEAIFYDDVKYNTDLVERLGVTSYLVDDRRGIVFDEIQIVEEVKNVNVNVNVNVKEKLRLDRIQCINEQLNCINTKFNEIDEKLKTCKTEYEEQSLLEKRFEYEEQSEELEEELNELSESEQYDEELSESEQYDEELSESEQYDEELEDEAVL